MKKVFLYFLFLGMFCPHLLQSQSSIYQDARELAALFKNTPEPVLDFKDVRSGEESLGFDNWDAGSNYWDIGFNYYFNKDGSRITMFKKAFTQPPIYPIQTFGKYELRMNVYRKMKLETAKLSPSFKWDAITITFWDSTFVIGGPALYNVEIIFTPDTLVILSTYSDNEEDMDNSSLNNNPPSGNLRQVVHCAISLNFGKMINIMRAHSDFRNIEERNDNNNIYATVKQKYTGNPFFIDLFQRNNLLFPNTVNFVSDLGHTKNYFPDFFRKNYAWHELLYGDSILQLQKQVSYQDVVSNYRTPIVTSQSELIDENNRINDKNRNRNVLDAKSVAVGLSDFIAERAQEELNLTFFNRFKENLAEESELTVLFPNTRSLLYQFEISNYKTLLSNARESFSVDLDNLGLNFPKILELSKYKDLYNSPEVYNLALIYYIANLAYREEPVETILISTFQKLQERERQLDKSINLTIAEAVLNQPFLSLNNDALTSSEVITPNDSEFKLPELAAHVDEYINAIENCKEEILTSTKMLDEELQDERYEFMHQTNVKEINVAKDRYGVHLKTIWNQNQSNLYNAGLPKVFNNRSIIYNKKSHNEAQYLSFYKKTIYSNLKGKEYYGYLLNDENKNITDYSRYFKNKPEEEREILARGIAGSHNLLDEKLENILIEKLEELQSLSVEVREIKTDLLQFELENQTWAKQIGSFGKRIQLLKAAIDSEIYFWKNVSHQDSTDHQIAALYYLSAIFESDNTIKTFMELYELLFVEVDGELQQVRQMPTSHSASPDGRENSRLFNDYCDLLGLNEGHDPEFTRSMKYAQEMLDSVQINFEYKIQELFSEYKNELVAADLFEKRLIPPSLGLGKESLIKEIEDAFKEKRDTLEASIQERKENDAAYQELQINLEPLDAVMSSLDSLAEAENRELTEAEQETYNTIQINYQEISDALTQIEKQYDEELAQLIEQLEIKKEEDIVAILAEEAANNISTPVVATADLLKNNYQLSENAAYKKYQEEIIKSKTIDIANFAFLDSLDARLEEETAQWNELYEKRRQIENNLNSLENDYCKNLVDARINAKNLAKGMELATHLLFAFRDYEKDSTDLFYTDTSEIIITTNQVDTATGYIMGTATLDTIQVNKKAINESLKEKNIARWITRKEFDDLQSDETEWNIFLGLLYQRLRSVEDAPDFSSEGVALLATKFLTITNDMEKYRTNLRTKKAVSPGKVSFKDYYPFIRSTVDLFNTVITTQSFSVPTKEITEGGIIENTSKMQTLADRDSSLQRIPQLSNQALSLYENIYIRNYGNAILNAMELLRIMSSQKLSTRERRQSERAVNAVLTYGTFMANMIRAETSDQVKNILKSVTLPPGSSRIKRETTSSFTINSYLGAAFGRDVLIDAPDGVDKSAFGAAMSVPIGFTYSVSPNWIKNSSSFSLFVPLLDLGAITAYRQNPKNDNYTIDDLPEFKWDNLFSPGLFAVYNFANSPFCLGFGGQYGPQLRKIQLDNSDPVFVNSFRFPMVFFNVDVPFFNLHTGTRKIIVK